MYILQTLLKQDMVLPWVICGYCFITQCLLKILNYLLSYLTYLLIYLKILNRISEKVLQGLCSPVASSGTHFIRE